MACLALIRHGESHWNALGKWTGWTDIDLDEKGKRQARAAGKALKNIPFDIAFTSKLRRAQHTLEEVKKSSSQEDLPTIESPALNERNYGDLTGKNKWRILLKYGRKQFLKWRRSWDSPVPGGESLKDVYERVVPYYQDQILPHLLKGENVIISAHGNSLRALTKYLENISNDAIAKIELPIGEVVVYTINEHGKVLQKVIRSEGQADLPQHDLSFSQKA